MDIDQLTAAYLLSKSRRNLCYYKFECMARLPRRASLKNAEKLSGPGLDREIFYCKFSIVPDGRLVWAAEI